MPHSHITCIKLPHICSSHGHITNLTTRAKESELPKWDSTETESNNGAMASVKLRWEPSAWWLVMMVKFFSMPHTVSHLHNCPCGLTKRPSVKLSFTYIVHTFALLPPKWVLWAWCYSGGQLEQPYNFVYKFKIVYSIMMTTINRTA